MAVQILNATTGASIIAVDMKQSALDVATEHGADIALISGDDTASDIRKRRVDVEPT